jgi:hypothetical protein
MGDKRKRNNSDPNPSYKKRILEAFYKFVSENTLRKIRKAIPDKKIKIVSAFYKEEYESDLEKLKKVVNEEKIGILIGVYDYSGQSTTIPEIHKNHCISVFKWDNTLYCFDPWGEKSNRFSDIIFQKLKNMLNCSEMFIYKGPYLQRYNTTGICVGLSSNFLIALAIRQKKLGYETSKTIKQARIDMGKYKTNEKLKHSYKRRVFNAKKRYFNKFVYTEMTAYKISNIETNLSKITHALSIKK